MRKLFFLILFAVPLFAQMDTDSTRAIVPRTTSKGMIGTPAKIWRAIRADTGIFTYKPIIGGTTMGTEAFTDSLYRAAQEALMVKKADSTIAAGYATRTMLQADTLYRKAQQAADSTWKNLQLATKQAILMSRNVTAPASGTLTPTTAADTIQATHFKVTTKLIPPTSGQVGFWTRNGTAPASGKLTTSTSTDTVSNAMFQRNSLTDSVALKKDFPRVSFSISLDSSYINLTDTVLVALPDYSIVLDSVGYWTQKGAAADVDTKWLYGTSSQASYTAIITSAVTVTTAAAKVWKSGLNNATLPANGLVGILFSETTAKPKQIIFHFVGHRVLNGVTF